MQLALVGTRSACSWTAWGPRCPFLRRCEQRRVLGPDRALTADWVNNSIRLQSRESRECVEVTGVWERGCWSGMGMILQLHLWKAPPPPPVQGWLRKTGKCLQETKQVRESSSPAALPGFISLGRERALCVYVFGTWWDLGVYFLVLMNLLPGWECFNSEGTDTWQANTPWYM